MTDKTSMRLIAVVLTVMTVGGIAVSGVAVAQETPGSDEDVDTQQSSHLRVIHAASDAPAVDVAVDNETVATGVEAGNASDYLQLESGNHTIQVTASSDDANATDNESGETLFEGQIYLEQRTSSTLALTADQNQTTTGGAAETPTDDNETDMGTNETDTESAFGENETEDNETTFGANETEDNETTLGENETDTESAFGANETEDNETTLGENETDTESAFGANETEDNETTFGENETETESAFGENETEGGAAEAPTNDTQAPSLTPVMYVDNAWQPSDDQAALSVIHLASGADAVDVTVADNESDAGTESADENTTAGNETDANQSSNATVIADDLEFQDASDYVTVPAGDHTLEIRQASENNDGQIITTVNVSVEGGNAYSALAMSGDNATNQTTTGGAAETPTDDNETTFGENETDTESAFGENETEDNETTFGANETDTESAFGENETEDNETTLGENTTDTESAFGANETEDNETTLGENETDTESAFGENETEDNETTLGDNTTDTETEMGANETEDNETTLGDTSTQSQVSLNVTTVQDVTYSINLPNQNATDNSTVDTGDDDTDADEEDNETTSIALAG